MEAQSSSSQYLPVGGRIFYIHSDNGATYRFFDSSYSEITTISVSGLANAVYYTKEGDSSADKFYVYDNTTGIVSGKTWGTYETYTGAGGQTIGTGKTNTARILSSYSSSMGSMWTWLRDTIRANEVGGCSDWYIGSMAEYNQLRASGLVTWFRSYAIWSSYDFNGFNAYFWAPGMGSWERGVKNDSHYTVAIRSF